MESTADILEKLSAYGELIVSGLLIMLGGMVAILLLYRLVAALIKPGTLFSRIMKVVFGAIYALILVITVMLAAERLGYDVEGLAGIAILLVIVGAIVVFFLIPFLPRLPYVVGDMVQLRGVMGSVEAITAYQTVVRTFDGQTVYLPTALVMAGAISNFTQVPQRRVELTLTVNASDDLGAAKTQLLTLMSSESAVLAEPPPAVFVTGIEDGRATLFAFCWVANADWFATRDALWIAAAEAFSASDGFTLAAPQVSVKTESST